MGVLTATAPKAGDHGPVRSDGFGLVHADGLPHLSVGTTSYQWASKGSEMQRETLDTLATAPFNKMRMTVFPKWYVYNHANPVQTGAAFPILPGSLASNASAWECVGAACPPLAGSFDVSRFNVSFWRQYERLVVELGKRGVVADVILFHPYDGGHWGFDCLGGRDARTYDTTTDRFYLRYAAARLAAYSNVWWAMANEWSFCACKARGINSSHLQSPSPVWDELFQELVAHDPYARQTSIHNGNLLYNHSRPWISHVSLQGLEDRTADIRSTYGKPVIWDEVQYEGDIPEQWGGLSGAEEAARFWGGAALGVYVGHSETLLRPDVADDDEQPLWWAKGGTLVGTSPVRVAWFRKVWDAALSGQHGAPRLSFGELQPSSATFPPARPGQKPVANVLNDTRHGALLFAHFGRAGAWSVPLPRQAASGEAWHVALLDYYAMEARERVLPTNATHVTVTVAAVPFDVMLSRRRI